jgi:signal transduction histidine kinase
LALRVLVADDIEASREHLCAVVRSLGHTPFSASNGQETLEQVQKIAPDIVLLDLLMPDMNGFEVTQRICALVTHRWLPVIVTSSLQGDDHFIHALQQGADDCMVRPISPDLLDAKLRHYARVLGLQSKLSALAQRQRAIQDNILDAVITLNDAGVIEQGNAAAARMFGLRGSTVAGQDCVQTLGIAWAVLRTQKECVLVRNDGAEFSAEIAFSTWEEAGQVQHTVVIRDLTERHHIARMKDEFLASVSHELRTPLTSILGALGILGSGAAGALPPAALPIADIAKRNAERLSRLIDDVLDLTKLEGDRMVLQARPSQLGPLLTEAMAANEGYAARTGVRLDVKLIDRCPSVAVDVDRFMQIMANLLSNAIKHSMPGDTVCVQLECTSATVSVKVRDQGPGIDPAFRARLFEKFSQADGSDRRAQGGTGLGLYITRMLVERMGGRITLGDEPEQGATFVLEFALQAPTAGKAAPWVLHIDKDIDSQRRVADWLGTLCTVECAADLTSAKGPFPHTLPPILIADTQAQGSAQEFCESLKSLWHGPATILYSDGVDDAFARAMGVVWLKKSASGRDEIRAAVKSAMAQHNRKNSQ